jgi:hypothetical protein
MLKTLALMCTLVLLAMPRAVSAREFSGLPPSAAVSQISSVPPTAAGMEVSVQDDPLLVYGSDRDAQFAALARAGANVVRMNLIHAKGRSNLPKAWKSGVGGGEWKLAYYADMLTYDAAVAAAWAHGIRVEMTLLWYGQNNPRALKKWMKSVAAHFAGRVFRFSILNEPDLLMSGIPSCSSKAIHEMVAGGIFRDKMVKMPAYRHLSSRQAKSFRGARFARVSVSTSVGGHETAYKRAPHGKYRKLNRWQLMVVRGGHVQRHLTAKAACRSVRKGRQYRKIVQAVVPAIRAAAPSAQVMIGETSSRPGMLLFAKTVTRPGLPRVDGWLHHPYLRGEGSIFNAAAVRAAIHGLPLGYDEFGYAVNWPDRVTALRRAWAQARADGVFQMNQFGIQAPTGGTWNTSLGGDFSLLSTIASP